MKLLYVDVPFNGYLGGDKNRSRFLWNKLSENYDCDILLLTDDIKEESKYSGYSKIFTISKSRGSLLHPESVYSFSKDQIEKYKNILRENNYSVVIFRFASTSELAIITHNFFNKIKVIVDIDMLLSRISRQSWECNKSIKNRFYFLEYLKLIRYEKKLFLFPFTFLFTNSFERSETGKLFAKSKGQFKILPNVMENVKFDPSRKKENYILFFGALDSSANQDGFKFLMENIYDSILPKLKKFGMKLKIVGKKATQLYDKYRDYDCVDIVGPVDDIYDSIQKAQFVLLPLRVASGTRTRILEAAALKQLIITTPVGVEGLDFGDEEILISDNAQGLVGLINKALDNEFDSNVFGENIYLKSKMLYSEKAVEDKIKHLINNCK